MISPTLQGEGPLQCRSCESNKLWTVLNLGLMPPSDRLLRQPELSAEERKFPLELVVCEQCSLAQITESVDPEYLFGSDYLYFSSFSDALLNHSRANALALIESQKLNAKSFVVEIASNDGYLLKNFIEHGIPVLGVDPAPKQAAVAVQNGVPTLNEFFTESLAKGLVERGQQADVIIANNVVAHVADVHDLIRGMALLLKPTGVISIEVPYVKELVDKLEFDTIYHEHLCYFSLTSLDRLFRIHGLFINDVERIEIHGGSLRVQLGKNECRSDVVLELMGEERDAGMQNKNYYEDFATKVADQQNALRSLILDLKSQGKTVAAYGAAAKGSILVNSSKLTSDEIDYVVDRNIHKHGLFMPGSHIEICGVERLLDEMPDYVLLLPWNFKSEIIQQQREYLNRGGRFIMPVPTIEILDASSLLNC